MPDRGGDGYSIEVEACDEVYGTVTPISELPIDDQLNWSVVAYVVGVYVTGAIIMFGIAGNVLSCFILLRSGRRTSMYCIMEALCLSDTVILIANLAFQILPNLNDSFTQFYPFYYIYGQLAIVAWPISFAAQMATVWLTVLISVERWIAVCKPLLTAKYCSYKRTRTVCYAVCTFSIVYCSPRFFEYSLCRRLSPEYYSALPAATANFANETETDDGLTNQGDVPFCQSKENGTGYSLNKNPALGSGYLVFYCAILYFLFVFLIPVVLIAVLNIRIIAELQQSKATWANLSRNQKKERKITKLPIGIVLLFLLSGAPALAVNVLDAAAIHVGSHWDFMVTIGNLLIMVNSATNFIVYCLMGKDFRRALMNLFALRKAQSHVSNSNATCRTITGNTLDRDRDTDDAESDSVTKRDCGNKYRKVSNKATKIDMKHEP